MEDAEKLPLPRAFLDFLKENELDPSIYTAIDSIPRYIRLKPGCEAYIEEVQAEMKCKLRKEDWLAGFYSSPPDIQIASSKAYREGKMCVFLCLGGNSSTWLNTAVLVTCLRNFPKNRGPVSGILKGYVGLSTAIFTDICTALFSSDPSTFLLMLAIVPAVICFIAVLFLRESPPASTFAEEKQETQFFNIFNIVAITVAVYLLAFDITGRHEMVKTLDFWVVFVSFLCGVGTGLCVMNNMGQIGLALGYSDVSIFISFISIWGFFGRIFSGSLSEYFIRKSAMPRPLWNAASQILMCLGYVAMAMALPGSLYIGSMIVGICYGVRFAVTVPIASELFGLKYFGLLYNIIILNLPLGSVIFSGLIAGFLYDAQATSVPGGGNVCIGPNCYMLVFVIMAITCVLGCGLDLFLALRTKNVYSKIQLEKSYGHFNTVGTDLKGLPLSTCKF
ncbi:hypothetical protein L6164_020172 [Bauhinia variegata]|uniref:Uncharacterized protein n=1 Tax=Bauhinia variegata TaxID=167791 RepID=A0ACB9MVK9_BAUVA|nr:hypothetical protein L6164_020172 [Bauhinia variegata]